MEAEGPYTPQQIRAALAALVRRGVIEVVGMDGEGQLIYRWRPPETRTDPSPPNERKP